MTQLYPIVLETEDSGAVSAYVPGLPVYAAADTHAKAERAMFLTTTAAAGAGFTIVPRHVLGRGFQAPSDTVNIATVGFGGMGGSNTRRLMSQNIVAICDVDDALVDAQLKRMQDDAAQMPAAPQQPQSAIVMSKAQAAANARRPRIDNAAALRRFTASRSRG